MSRRKGKQRTCKDCGKPCMGQRCPDCREKVYREAMSGHANGTRVGAAPLRYVSRDVTEHERNELALVPRLNTVLDAERLILRWQRGEA